MNTAILGGAFDPPHIGHFNAVNKIREMFPDAQIVIVPTFRQPLKESGTDFVVRKGMCDILFSQSNIYHKLARQHIF